MTTAISSRLCWYASAAQVAIEVGSAGIAHVSNIRRCGSAWACPACAPVVRERRAVEVDQGVSNHLARGGSVLFLTLTVRHHRLDELAPRLDAVAQSLGKVFKGAGWERRRDRLGFVGSIKAVEITYGENGWHPHSHSLVLFDRHLTDVEVQDFRAWVYGRWSNVVVSAGFGSIDQAHGVDLRRVTDGDGIGGYVNKIEGGWTAGHEVTRGDRKGSSPLDLLRGFVQTGEVRQKMLWQEYETATYGKRSLRWSAGLRGLLLGDDVEVSDIELAASEGADLTLLRALIDSDRWNTVVRAGAAGQLLTNIEEVAGVLLGIVVLWGGVAQPLDLDLLDQALDESGGAGVSPAGASLERRARSRATASDRPASMT